MMIVGKTMEHVSIKALPEAERPYEKLMARGVDALSDAELIAVIIRSGTREANSVEVATRILRLCSPEGSLAGLKHLSHEALCGVEGIGKIKAMQIQCLGELCSRMHMPVPRERQLLNTPEKAAAHYMYMAELEREEMRLVFLDTRNRRIQDVMLSRGTVNASLVSTREVFIEALRGCAVNLLMIHNHPSGDPAPSREDIELTRKVQQAGQLLDIRLLDHIVVAESGFCSMRASGLLQDE